MTNEKSGFWLENLYKIADIREQICCELDAGGRIDNPAILAHRGKYGGKSLWRAMSQVGQLCGVGLVSGWPMTVIGTAALLDLWCEAAPAIGRTPKEEWPVLRATVASYRKTWRPKRHHAVWAKLVDENLVRHRLALEHPGFRIWPDQPGYVESSPHQVQLRRSHGGQSLGGIFLQQSLV